MPESAGEVAKKLLQLWAAPGPWLPGEAMEEGLIRLSVPILTAYAEQAVAQELERVNGLAMAMIHSHEADCWCDACQLAASILWSDERLDALRDRITAGRQRATPPPEGPTDG